MCYSPIKKSNAHSSRKPRFVGWYTLEEDKVIQRSWETACNYTNVKVSAGSYPVYHYDYELKSCTTLYINFTGVVVEEYYRNSFGSSCSHHRNETVGNIQDVSSSYYAYEAKKDVNFLMN